MEKNPTSSSKSGVFWEKKIKTPIGSRHFFEGSLILLKICSYEVQMDLFFPYLEKKCGKSFKLEKNPLKVRKSGVFVILKGSLILLKIWSYEVQVDLFFPYLEKKCGKIFKWKKIQLQVSKSGVFWGKKIFRKVFETSVIIS